MIDLSDRLVLDHFAGAAAHLAAMWLLAHINVIKMTKHAPRCALDRDRDLKPAMTVRGMIPAGQRV
jgi:hypothetical protein